MLFSKSEARMPYAQPYFSELLYNAKRPISPKHVKYGQPSW